LPAHVRITHQVIWPLFLLPVALLNQLLTPHPVWIVLVVALFGMYGVALFWVRHQAPRVTLQRQRLGAVLVAGDALREEFSLRNESTLPVLWAEFLDYSTLPEYHPGRVVGCGADATYRWHAIVQCRRRGIYQLGPHALALGDPLGLFRLDISYEHHDLVLIYPRVAHLPSIVLPQGDANGAANRRRPLWGVLPSASVRDYQAADSLRYIHWPQTAHRGALMVKELEIEPSGAVWIVLDLHKAVHHEDGDLNTLEFSVVLAASLAAELLTGGDRRTVGLLAVSAAQQLPIHLGPSIVQPPVTIYEPAQTASGMDHETVVVGPQPGQAQLWRILAALAPVQAADVPLAAALRSNRAVLGRRATVVVITPQVKVGGVDDDWAAELVHLHVQGVTSSAMLVTAGEGDDAQAGRLRNLLARYDIPLQTLRADARLPTALTFRRTRKVIRNTPTGGVITYEVEEEAG
jgi:uncharacterized protein (DUF58 family)